MRERTEPPLGREFEQVVEFSEFDRPRHVHVHIVEGRAPVDGGWSFEPARDGTRVTFVAEGGTFRARCGCSNPFYDR